MEKSHQEKTPPVNRSNAENQEKSHVQTKMNIGPSNDKYEKETDSTADRVTSDKAMSFSPVASSISPLSQRQVDKEEQADTKLQKQDDKEEQADPKLQRQEEEEESTESNDTSAQGKLQMMADEEEVKTKIQPKNDKEEDVLTKTDASGRRAMTKEAENKIRSTRGRGALMSEGLRADMEKRFGADFGEVKIHDDSDAHDLCKQLKAQAFTVGKDIYFARGKFEPDTQKGRHLLAHELTHTIQQSGGRPNKR